MRILPECIEKGSLLFSFDDQRNKEGKGHVVGLKGRILNHTAHDVNSLIRFKFLLLFPYSLIHTPLLDIPWSLIQCISLEPITKGIEKGKHLYQENLLLEQNPNYNLCVATSVLVSIAHTIWLLITYPLYLIARQSAVIWGLFFPLDGVYMISCLQESWTSTSLFLPIAPCMLSQQFFREHNLYKRLANYHPNRTKSLHLQLENIIKNNPVFFTFHDDKKMYHFEALLDFLSKIHPDIERFSAKASYELFHDKEANDYLLKDQQQIHREACKKLPKEIYEQTPVDFDDPHVIEAERSYKLYQLQKGLTILLNQAKSVVKILQEDPSRNRQKSVVKGMYDLCNLFWAAYQKSENGWKCPEPTEEWQNFLRKSGHLHSY